MNEEYEDCFSPEFKRYLLDLKEEDYEEYQALMEIINNDSDSSLEEILKKEEKEREYYEKLIDDIANNGKVPTLEEIDFIIKKENENEKFYEENKKQLKETSEKLDKLNDNLEKWIGKVNRRNGIGSTHIENIKEEKEEKIILNEKEWEKEYSKICERYQKFIHKGGPKGKIKGDKIRNPRKK